MDTNERKTDKTSSGRNSIRNDQNGKNQATEKQREDSAARRRRIAEIRRRNRMIYRARLICFIAVCAVIVILVIVGLVKVISGLTGGKNAGTVETVTETETVTEIVTEEETTTEAETEETETTEEEQTTASATVQAADGETVYATVDVNIRSGPSTDTDILGTLTAGQSIVRVYEQDGWSTVQYNGTVAYIKSDYLTTTNPADSGSTATTASDDSGTDTAAAATTAAAAASVSYWTGDLSTLSTEAVNFGYAEVNRDANMIPTDWAWYESQWGQFNVDWIQDTTQPVIYLTMDEGFANDQTSQELDILKEKGVSVTFFLTKYFVDECPDLVQRMIDEGHQLGDHTCTHPDMTSLSVEEQTDEIMTLRNQVQEQFGYDMKLFRFPQGKYSEEALGLVDNLGMKTVFWTYAYEDYNDEQPPVDESLQNALSHLHNGAIYLLHAKSQTNLEMLSDFIDGARERGFEFGVYPLTDN